MKNQKITFTTIVALGCLAFLPQTQAVSPAPDGCYPNYTTAEGCNALNFLATGAGNTGLGWYALFADTTGSFNTGVGGGALALNNGDSNTATGAAALLLNTDGGQNTAVGTDAMVFNDTGNDNAALGAFALFNNISSSLNTAVGSNALFSHTDSPMASPSGLVGSNNALGAYALYSDETGASNNAFGASALFSNISGTFNTAVGDFALGNSTGNYNTALGAGAGTDPGITSNNIYIGDPGFPGDENVISIGGIAASGTPYELTFIGGIYGGQVSAGALPVYIDSDGHLGTTVGPANGKNVKVRSSKGGHPQAMSKEFQKQQKRIAELEVTVAHQQKNYETRLAQQEKQIESLTAGLQKVSAQLEATRPAPQIVSNR